MRLIEFLSAEEWARLEQLIFDTTWKALATYQQQRATQRNQQISSIAQLTPRANARKGQLARKTKLAPHAAPPKPLPRPVPAKIPAPATALTVTSYNPIKTAKPLPASTRDAINKSGDKPHESFTSIQYMDQRARAMLPKSKRGPNIWDMVDIG